MIMTDHPPEPAPIDRNLLTQLFRQSREIPIQTKGLTGKHFNSVNSLYKEPEAVSRFVTEQVAPTMAAQTLETGTFLAPPYHRQEGANTCNLAVFRMFMEGLTGATVSEKDIFEAAKETGLLKEKVSGGGLIKVVKVDPPHFEDLLKVFKTPLFMERYPNIIATYAPIIGADFDDMKEFAADYRKRFGESTQLLLALSLGSEQLKNDVHRVALLSADRDNVVMHDPSNVNGSAFRFISKNDFVQRYGRGDMFGHMVIAKKLS